MSEKDLEKVNGGTYYDVDPYKKQYTRRVYYDELEYYVGRRMLVIYQYDWYIAIYKGQYLRSDSCGETTRMMKVEYVYDCHGGKRTGSEDVIYGNGLEIYVE